MLPYIFYYTFYRSFQHKHCGYTVIFSMIFHKPRYRIPLLVIKKLADTMDNLRLIALQMFLEKLNKTF